MNDPLPGRFIFKHFKYITCSILFSKWNRLVQKSLGGTALINIMQRGGRGVKVFVTQTSLRGEEHEKVGRCQKS